MHLKDGQHVFWLSTRNLAFANLLAQIIQLRTQFPIKTIHLDDTGKFTSQAFNDYCMFIITLEHPVAHVHMQNGQAELIARSLLMKIELLVSVQVLATLHVAAHVGVKPTSYHKFCSFTICFWSEGKYLSYRSFQICGICPDCSITRRILKGG